jgi:hypothetical protein
VIAAVGLVIPLALIFLRHTPAEIGLMPCGATEPPPPFAAWGAGFTRSWLGTYEPAFLISGALGIAAAAMSLVIGRRIVRPLFA